MLPEANLAILSGGAADAHATLRLAASGANRRIFVDVVRPLCGNDERWSDGALTDMPAQLQAGLASGAEVKQLPVIIRGGAFEPYIPTTDGLLIQ